MSLTRQKKRITKYISFKNVNKKDLVSISNTDNLALFIYPVFYMLDRYDNYQDNMTILRTNNKEN